MIEGRDFLDVGVFLQQLDGEASARAQIGRAYYAAYLEARSYCETQLGYSRSKASREHGEIPKLLIEIDPDVAASLAFVRQLRHSADYDLELNADTVALQADTAKVRAESIITRLDSLVPTGTDA